MNKTFTFIVVLIYILSCNTVRNGNQEANLKHVWMLTEFQNYSKEDLVSKNTFLDLTNEMATAKMGCNNLSFKKELKEKNEITFSNCIATQMACEDMSLEDDFLKKLPEIKSYSIVNHQLIMEDDKGNKMVFVAQDWD
jgi:heat shock protein HslJ